MEEKQILRDNGEVFVFDKPRDKNGKSLSIGDSCKWWWGTGTIDKFILSNRTLEVGFRYKTKGSDRTCVYIKPEILEKVESDSWEKILADSKLDVFEYIKKYPEADKRIGSIAYSTYRHLFERCKKLAGVEE